MKTKVLSVRIPEPIMNKIKEISEKNNQTKSEVVKNILNNKLIYEPEKERLKGAVEMLEKLAEKLKEINRKTEAER